MILWKNNSVMQLYMELENNCMNMPTPALFVPALKSLLFIKHSCIQQGNLSIPFVPESKLQHSEMTFECTCT